MTLSREETHVRQRVTRDRSKVPKAAQPVPKRKGGSMLEPNQWTLVEPCAGNALHQLRGEATTRPDLRHVERTASSCGENY